MSPESGRPAAKAAKTPAGLPVWRTGKPDAVLAAAVEVAREGILSIADAGQIGAHLGARSEGERVVTHLFECTMPGYLGWQWFAVLARVSRSKVATVDEVGLLPSEKSVVAPEWVPWADRVRPGDDDGDADNVAAGDANSDTDGDIGTAVADDGAAEDYAADSDPADSDAADDEADAQAEDSAI
ncbi:MAG TPA: DUF3027 domain-containing protein [Micrococcaceae bacterium]